MVDEFISRENIEKLEKSEEKIKKKIKRPLEGKPSKVLLATLVASASDYLGMIITSQPAVLCQLDSPIYFSEIYYDGIPWDCLSFILTNMCFKHMLITDCLILQKTDYIDSQCFTMLHQKQRATFAADTHCSDLFYRAVQCSARPYTAVHCRVVQCNARPYTLAHCTAGRRSALQ